MAGESAWPLAVCGPPGTGKTCAALCLCDHCDGDSRYWTAAGLCELLVMSQSGRLEWSREGYGGTVWPETVWRWVAGAALVVLDEVGCRDRVSDFAYETVKRVIDDRYGKPLVVLSNHTLDVVARLYDDRIADRLAEGTVIVLQGESRRLAGGGA